jgi:hypothetical protein
MEPSAWRPFVEYLAYLGTARDELVARGLDVGDDQVQALCRPGCDRREAGTELDRAPRAGWCELDDPEAVIEGEVSVEPPPQIPVELLRAVDVRDRDDDHLELLVHDADSIPLMSVSGCGVTGADPDIPRGDHRPDFARSERSRNSG